MTEEPEKVALETADLAAENRAGLEALFPGLLADGVLDADRLAHLLDVDVAHASDARERFGLMWAGKQDAVRALLTPSHGTLTPNLRASLDFDTAQNVFIEGDNLEVLKLLQKAYNDRVKMVYIDPPYNTGNDFVYSDDFSDGLQAYLEFSGQIDAAGNRTSASVDKLGRRHSRWLSMMYPRLILARNLLTQDGVIFVSIDDNEVGHLRVLMDEVFGPENFVATFVWEKRTNRENRKAVSYRHDYILCYVRQATSGRAIAQLPMNEKALANYSNPDDDPRGDWKSDPATAQSGHATPAQFYDLVAPNGTVHHLPSGRCWVYTKGVMDEAIRDGRIWFGKSGNGVPRIKTYLGAKDRALTPETIIFASDAGTNETAKNALKSVFDDVTAFETPKPVGLIQLLLQLGSRKDSIVMDFFAGSGTTAEAVLTQNATDGGARQFIAVQLPEPTGRDDYPHVSDITRTRIRAAMEAAATKSGLRDFVLSESNFARLEASETLFDLRESTLAGSPNWDAVAAEVLVKEGVPLDAAWRRQELAEAEVVVAGGVAVVLSLKITGDLVTEVLSLGAQVVVFMEDGFAGVDAVKANAATNAKNLGIVMKTV